MKATFTWDIGIWHMKCDKCELDWFPDEEEEFKV